MLEPPTGDEDERELIVGGVARLLVRNRRELAEATGLPVETEAQLVAAARVLREAHGFGAVLVTRSEDGMTLLDGSGVHHFPAESEEVYDVSGALFFGAAQKAMSALGQLSGRPRAVVLRLDEVHAMDATGLVALESALDEAARLVEAARAAIAFLPPSDAANRLHAIGDEVVRRTV